MFKDGFHNMVDIYPYKYNDSITMANNGYFDKDTTIKDVNCRIRASNEFNIHKIFFSPNVVIKTGDGVYDRQNDTFYTVDNVKKVYLHQTVHHITCFVSKSFEKADVLDER